MLLLVFALRKPRDWLIKPLTVLAAINGTFLLVENQFVGIDYSFLRTRIALTTLVAAPFVAMAFAMMAFLFRVQRQLAQLAMTDGLTGLPNRRAFMDQTKRSFVDGRSGYLLLLDADYFKRINDSYGHAIGDVCLAALAERIQHIMSNDDVIGRIGGEEFAAFMPAADKARLIQIGRRLTEAVRIPINDEIGDVRMTMSIGATDTSPLEPVETAMKRADIALYEAKETGRARMVFAGRKAISQVA